MPTYTFTKETRDAVVQVLSQLPAGQIGQLYFAVLAVPEDKKEEVKSE